MKVLHVATDEGVPTANPKRLTATANRPILAPMSDLCKLSWCTLIGLFRSRAALEAGAVQTVGSHAGDASSGRTAPPIFQSISFRHEQAVT